ncbi:binding partner of ACD11 1 [Coffea arabica]|uniref:Binding partner of ACD11 1 n=1 Tax=Coffea arabica TaxID=13443 RepID=A0A6P6TBI5_COFAR
MQLVGHTVEVTGLSPKVTEKEVHEFFSCCGEILHIEFVRHGEYTCTAYVTFKDAYAVETAILLSGASIGNQCVSISRLETYVDESFPQNNHSWKVDDGSSAREDNHADQFVYTPGEAVTAAQEVVTSMIAKGYILSKDALAKAKAFDESYQVSSTAAAKVVELSNRIGLTDKINSGVEAVKSVDKKYHVSETTMTAASYTGRTAVAAANAVVSSSYFATGALWVSSVLDRASKAAADLANRGVRK